MIVNLAGYNIDTSITNNVLALRRAILEDNLAEVQRLVSQIPDEFTPETIAAAYARISRSPDDADKLRQDAVRMIARARQSCENIVHELGHASVAEHAYFNFDLIGISRWLVNIVEERRLASFTEKSMRYVLFNDDFVMPVELADRQNNEHIRAFLKSSFELYRKTHAEIISYLRATYTGLPDDFDEKGAAGRATEDARYCLPYATKTQLGLSINGRNLEHLVQVLDATPLAEAQELKNGLMQTGLIAPSLVKYLQATAHQKQTRFEIRNVLPTISDTRREKVSLLDHTPHPDEEIALSMLSVNSGTSYHAVRAYYNKLPPAEQRNLKETVIRESLRLMNVHDTPLREFERAHFFFETEISAAAYAQLKRHRMLSLYRLPETADLGCVVPALVQAVSATDAYEKQYAHARELYRTTLQEVGVGAAGYVLPLSTVTRVQFETNMREAYHMSRMREDAHAQWEIREMMIDASNHIRTVAPLSSMLLGGKHEFPDIYASAFETVNP